MDREGTVKQKVDRYGQGQAEGLKIGKNMQTSFMDDPYSKIFYFTLLKSKADQCP